MCPVSSRIPSQSPDTCSTSNSWSVASAKNWCGPDDGRCNHEDSFADVQARHRLAPGNHFYASILEQNKTKRRQHSKIKWPAVFPGCPSWCRHFHAVRIPRDSDSVAVRAGSQCKTDRVHLLARNTVHLTRIWRHNTQMPNENTDCEKECNAWNQSWIVYANCTALNHEKATQPTPSTGPAIRERLLPQYSAILIQTLSSSYYVMPTTRLLVH